MNFFDKRFFQTLLVSLVSTLITLVVALFVSFYIGGQIERLTGLFDSVSTTLTHIETLVVMGPEGITDVTDAIDEGAVKAGDAIGDGAASVIDKAGEAWKSFNTKE